MTPPRLELRGLRGALAGPFDLALAPGSCLAVTGPSGAGKSLFLRMIADLDPHDGEALLDGQPRSAMPASAWRAQVVYNAAEPGWWTERVADHFGVIPVEAASALGLGSEIFGQPVRLCSTGERQRLSLLRALAGTPRVLLLDEPTASLDEESVARTEALLRTVLAGGTALVVVTHDLAQAARLGAVQQARLEQGRFVVPGALTHPEDAA